MGQGLGECINLVIVGRVGKGKKLVFEINEPRRVFRKEHLPVCELFQLNGDACQLVAFWDDADRRKPNGFQILYQRSSEQPGFFNQNLIRPMFLRLRNGVRFQFRIKKSTPKLDFGQK